MTMMDALLRSLLAGCLLTSTLANPGASLADRAPHFAAILSPGSGYLVYMSAMTTTPPTMTPTTAAGSSRGNSSASFNLTYSNGERYDETTVTLSLRNTTGDYALARGIAFSNSYWIYNASIPVNTTFTDGNYTLAVTEYTASGQITSQIIQPIGIRYTASPAPIGNQTDVPPASWSSSSVLIPTGTAAQAASAGPEFDINDIPIVALVREAVHHAQEAIVAA